MTILFLTKLLPYPLDAGGKLKTYRILQLLARKHTIHFVSFIDRPDDRKWEKKIRPFCSSVKTFVQPVVNNQHAVLKLKYLSSIFSLTPFTIYKYCSHELSKYIEGKVLTKNLDALYIDHFAMAQYIPEHFQGKMYLDEHNISYKAFQTYAKKEKNWLMKGVYFLESWKLKCYESSKSSQFDHIFTISELDRKGLIAIGAHPAQVSFLPTPFSSRFLYKGGDAKIILFTGLLSWLPNEKGMYWFIENVFPLVHKELPRARFVIAGKNGEKVQEYIQSRDNRSVKYSGYVENLKKLYEQTSLFVVPIQMGGGVRIKLLEALSAGIPVVSSSIGAEGIDVKTGRELLIADTVKDFASSVIRLLQDQKLASKLAAKGYEFMKKNYSSHKTQKVLEKNLS